PPAISVPSGWIAGADLELSNNAAWQMAGSGPSLPAAVAGVPTMGNVDCTDPAMCWVDGAGLDLWPSDGSLLTSGGATPTIASELDVDFCGQPRAMPPTAGAFERTDAGDPGPITIAFKAELGCKPASGDTGGRSEGGDGSQT